MKCSMAIALVAAMFLTSAAGEKAQVLGPFASLEDARSAIRKLKKEGKLTGPTVAEITGGPHFLGQPFVLTSEDSGTAQAPITYRAIADKEVRLTGGKVVSAWHKVTDQRVAARLDPSARDKVVMADLRKEGINDFGSVTERGFALPIRPAHLELFFNDKPMTLARWPNSGYARVAGLPKGKNSTVFAYSGERPRRWLDEPEPWVYGYWYHDWADSYVAVKAIDPKAHHITMASPHRYGLRKGARWFALNLLSELDSPGEYYLDRTSGILCFWPPEPIEKGLAVVSVAKELIRLEETSHVTIEGFVVEACRGTAIAIHGGSHNRIVGCTIRNIGNRAVVLTGADNAVIGCHIHHTADGGITLSGGDRKSLTPARLLAENNHIHHYSRWCHTYRPAVGVGGCGNIMRHNLIHHGQHNAIQLSGNDHRLEFNEIHHVCYDTGDVGAFYMGRDWTARGTIIRYNYWHHITGPGIYGARGVYLDDQASGITVFGNVFYKVSRAVFIGGGCDNVVENNIFVDCSPAVHIDARGLGWQRKMTIEPNGTLQSRLRAMPYKSALWRKRYPTLANILDDDPGTPKRNRIVRNICVGGKWDDLDRRTRKFQTVEDNLVGVDPQFVVRAGGDFYLKPTSPAFKLGFKPIPLEKIGLYDDPRCAWKRQRDPAAP